MIKPNWEIFKAKFSENPQYHFEWFCYLLFCKETNQPHGVFRYKNQSAIETNPVNFDGHCIGFQSKFYDTTLSSNKAELIETIEKAKRDYPKLTKLLLYTNQEWTQAYPKKNNPTKKAQKPAAQKDIENKATQLGIVLEWRAASYFESPFVSQDCADLSKYFFVSDNSLLDHIFSQERHTRSILKSIKQSILFNGNEITIERNSILASLKDSSAKVSILCGKGGVGKTAEVKKLYQYSGDTQPIFAFKANEFELERLDDLTRGRSINDFLSFFGDSKEKILVIDSAEKLMDLSNQEPIKEFIDLAVEFGWRIIFTTRDHYFDDLNHLCLDVLGVVPNKLYVSELTEEELDELAKDYSFKMPSDIRLRSLLRLPFYLNSFLKFYDSDTEQSLGLAEFKKHLWNKKIKAGETKREKVFNELALQRANSGKFYLPVDSFDIEAADALLKDEVLGKKDTTFFISHDIYEEWALEKFIGISFENRASTTEFFISLGHSLAIRRSFRLWISEQLFINEKEIKIFIENTIDDNAIQPIWKDEIITAILLSDYSSTFFDNFESELLQNNLELLHRINFILRIACKEVDNSMLNLLGLKQSEIAYFTIPKGEGWSVFINFIFDKKENIGLENLKDFIPVLSEWNGSVKQGETTRKAALLCLEYYKWLESEDSYIGRGKFTDTVIKTIAYGASEIKPELVLVINEVCAAKEKSKLPYEYLAKVILKDLDGLHVAQALPEKTLELANACWLKEYEVDHYSRTYKEAEHGFGVVDDYDFNYSPDSALQTPIFTLLRCSPKATVDFILNFINKVTLNLVNHCGEDKFDKQQLNIADKNIEIYLDQQLWGAYRGAANTPNLIKSILMALEKFFLENAVHFKEGDLEAWLTYMLKNTNSSAIWGVVSSIVFANKDELFNVGKILFEVKEFFHFDTARLVFDSQQKGQLQMLENMTGGMQHGRMYHNERVKACDAEHRANSLENLCLYYQLFGRKGVVEETEVQRRQKAIWELIDGYYDELESEKYSENSKLWRMSLARMDTRKMDITTERVGDKVAINFNPELTPDLKDMSESNQEKQQQDYKFLPLSLWAKNKIEKNEDYRKYEQYELKPTQALSDLKGLFEKLVDEENPPSEDFIHFNRATHIYASVALIKYHRNELGEGDLVFCQSIVEEQLNQVFDYNYRYQISDGMDACFNVIFDLFEVAPEKIAIYKLMLIAGLMRTDSITVMGSQRFSAFAIMAIVRLWNKFDEDVQAIFWGYLTLSHRYIELIGTIRKECYEYEKFATPDFSGIWHRLFEENEQTITFIEENNIIELSNFDYINLDLHTKSIAIYLLPNDTRKWALDSLKWLVNTSVDSLFGIDRSNSNDYQSRHDFLKKFAIYILSLQPSYVPEILSPFVENFNASEGAADLLEEIISSQDGQASCENFWIIWGEFKPKVIQLAESKPLNYRFEKVVNNYLFALPWWKKDANNWNSFRDKDARFFNEMADKLSSVPSTLYSFAMLLNGIGGRYESQGVIWLAKIIKSKNESLKSEVDDNTLYYLNAYMRKFLYRERSKVRSSPELMLNTLVILDYLIEQGEVSGYLMRESIL